jgi:hypothetical protein
MEGLVNLVKPFITGMIKTHFQLKQSCSLKLKLPEGNVKFIIKDGEKEIIKEVPAEEFESQFNEILLV